MGRSIVELRALTEEDLPVLFEFQCDPIAHRMAAYPPRDHDDFMAHWREKILGDPEVIKRAILCNGEVAGNVLCFGPPEAREIGYWLGRDYWGRGVATRALILFLREVTERPLRAVVAKHNRASLRVLAKCGFRIVGEQRGPADGRGPVVEDYLLELGPDRP